MSEQLPPLKPWIVAVGAQNGTWDVLREDYDFDRPGDPDPHFTLADDEQATNLAFLLNTRDRLLASLRIAQADTCSLRCPSTWKTAGGLRPHSGVCQAISRTIAEAEGEAPYEL